MTIQKYSPVHGELLGEYPIASKNEVEEAVARARKAFPGWAAIPLERRLKQLDKLRKIIVEEGHSLPQLIHIWQLVVRHPNLFFSSCAQFVPQMVNSLNRIGLSPNCSIDNRKLAVELAQLGTSGGGGCNGCRRLGHCRSRRAQEGHSPRSVPQSFYSRGPLGYPGRTATGDR